MEANNGALRVFALALVSLSLLMGAVFPVLGAGTFLVWEGEVPSSGEEVWSVFLLDGVQYLIVAEGMWWYNYSYNLAADAMYYTTDHSNSWDWGNYFPAPGGHSFLQINGADVNWGPFSNGDTGHRYSLYYLGEGSSISFRIVDWMDGDYEDNICRLSVKIYREVTVGGYVVDYDSGMRFPSWIGILALASIIGLPFVGCLAKIRRKKT